MPLTKQTFQAHIIQDSLAVVDSCTIDKAASSPVSSSSADKTAAAKSKPQETHAPRPRVVVVERQLLQYRVAFYQRLRTMLDQKGIELQLLIGEGTPAEIKKRDQTTLDWTISIPTRYLLWEKICWQPYGSYARDADLVVVMHENKMIYNLWLMFVKRPKRLAFWGHGRNMQSDNPNGWKERFKRWTVNKVDWWFAYTESSADLVTATGFPRSRTTIVENAVDTNEMIQFCNEYDGDARARLRSELGIGNGPVGLYLGSLYKEKRLDFLLESAHRIKQKVPHFHLLVVGAGPDQDVIEAAAKQYNWIHYLGPLQGREKAKALVMSDIMLNPGLVGLGILDSFVSGSPMFTTDCDLHSPEISYLVPNVNGVMTRDNIDDYVGAIVTTLKDPYALASLREGALATARRYTVENMAQRICDGIVSCLSIK